MSNTQEFRNKAARILREGRKTRGTKKKQLSTIYRAVAETYKKLARDEEKMDEEKDRFRTRKN